MVSPQVGPGVTWCPVVSPRVTCRVRHLNPNPTFQGLLCDRMVLLKFYLNPVSLPPLPGLEGEETGEWQFVAPWPGDGQTVGTTRLPVVGLVAG